MPKVIGVDNLARDCNGGKSEVILAEGLCAGCAKSLADQTNKRHNIGDGYGDWFVVKSDDYKPYVFEGY